MIPEPALVKLWDEKRKSKASMVAHMPVVRQLASECESAIEFGVRNAYSTVALLMGCPTVHSWDIEQRTNITEPIKAAVGYRWRMHIGDSRTADFPSVDLLMHDSLHNYEQVRAELAAHADKVRKYLVFHDSTSHGDQGQLVTCGPREKLVLGIRPAIDELMIRDRTWFIKAHYPHSSGLLVLERRT